MMPELLPLATAHRTGRSSWQLRVNAFVLAWFVAALVVGLVQVHGGMLLWLTVRLLMLNVGLLLLVVPGLELPTAVAAVGVALVALPLAAFIALAIRLLLTRSRTRSRT